MDIHQKTALVTGAAKRVGREIAMKLAQKGARVLLHYNTSETEALKTSSEIKNLGADCRLFKADLSKERDIDRMVKEIYASGASVDILVNSASLFYKTFVGKTSEDDWNRLLDTNLKAPFFLSQVIGSHMRQNKGGVILNIADWSGLRPYKDYAAYCASKGGLITLTKAFARDLAPHVRVNAIAPGPVLLPPDFSEKEKEAIAQQTAVGRIGTPADIANAAAFLIDNDFINGTVLVVDGGRSIV